jgi:deoxyribodipyrimidine photo-lyase
MIPAERIRRLNDRRPQKGRFILYWMQNSQRVSWNHALQFAVREADRRHLPLVVLFTLVPSFPDASPGHYRFMLEGLLETKDRLLSQGIMFTLRIGTPSEIVTELGGDAAIVVTDRGYLNLQKQWRLAVAAELDCLCTEVESNMVVPVEAASSKEEWSAATFRRKITPLFDRFLEKVEERKPKISAFSLDLDEGATGTPESLLQRVSPDSPGRAVLPWNGGEAAAHAMLERFIGERLDGYARNRNDPNAHVLSNMSPYLHFGQISPLDIALRIRETHHPDSGVYLEELIVRRELSMNFVHYNPRYDSLEGLPDWAKKTLADHAGNKREYTYSADAFENGRTHDPYWNAAQSEMMLTGKMHGYMRMYWGKKILEWSGSPEEAYVTALALNNRYELDGRDPNGYTGVAWCFGKHDRAWPERTVFGKVRYMNAGGLKRKFDPDRYVDRIENLKEHSNQER